MRQIPSYLLFIPALLTALPCWAASPLKVGPNGPIPFIVVDQFGYPTAAAKVAVIRSPQTGYDSGDPFTPGTTYAVVSTSTGQIVKTGPLTAWNNGATDNVSGDKAWWFDFSSVQQPGTYVIKDVQQGVQSNEFEINDTVYKNVLKAAVRMFYYQRAGFRKTPWTAGVHWSDGASHMGPNQDPHTHPWPTWPAGSDPKTPGVRDLHGGWYDAGDYNKYTNWAARNMIVLLHAYAENPAAFGDDTGIAESGNGIPDILDEVKWAMDWLVRMQNPDGSVLCIQGLSGSTTEPTQSPPSTVTGPSYYGPATTLASLMSAAAFAYASKTYSAQPHAALKFYGEELAHRAQRAYAWAVANPSVTYLNNDGSNGSSGLGSGQQETMSASDRLFAQFEAAVYLYEITGQATYRTFAENNYANAAVSAGYLNQWLTNQQEALLYYARLPGASTTARTAILTQFLASATGGNQLPWVTSNQDPYRSPMQDWTWGSNMSKATQARNYELLALYGGGSTTVTAEAEAAGLEYMHYIHGVNPLGLVYLTNMKSYGAENSANTMWHSWFGAGTRWAKTTSVTPGPAPGYLVGGPNPYYTVDSCCPNSCGNSTFVSLCSLNYVPPLGQPTMKFYRQMNDGWPADSWQITEPSTGYQAQYVRALAHYVH